MGTMFQATTKSATAPDIEAGVFDASFDGVSTKFIEGGLYGDGDRFEWAFTLYEDGEVLYEEREENPRFGEPIQVTGLTSLSTNVLSKTTPKAVRYLKAIMTAPEFASFEAGEGVDEKALVGRMVQVEVAIKDSGWPGVASVLPAKKGRTRAKAAPAVDVDDE